MSETIILSNGVRLEFAVTDGLLRGLAQATVAGLALITPGSLRLPHVETRDGWVVTGYRVTGITPEAGGVVLEADALGVRPPLGRRTDMFQFPYLQNPRRTPEKIGVFRWRIVPENVSLGHAAVRQQSYAGFSYRYEFTLDHVFHWILDAGTWEIGGMAEGVTLLSQHMAAVGGPMEQTLSRSGPAYTSGETFSRGKEDARKGYLVPIQAQLRGAAGALVDVQFKHDGILLCFSEQANYCRTLIEWQPGDTGIGHLDQHFFPLTQTYATPPKTILAARVPGLTRAAALNLWTDAWDHVAGAWRRQAGVSALDPVPGLGLDSCGRAGIHLGYGPADIFDRWEARFAWLAERGIKTFYLAGIGSHRGHELPGVGNLCQPYDYQIHPRYGGPERFRAFCDRAHSFGLQIVHWIGAPSDSAPILKQHPDWVIRHDSDAPWDGNYLTLNAASLRRGFGDWLLAELRSLKDLGVDAVFFDSYHNLWAMPIDYGRPDLAPQFPDLLALQAECEKMGLACWTESFTPVGLTSAPFWPEYAATPELCYMTHFRVSIDDHVAGRENAFQSGAIPSALYFRLLANKAPLGGAVMELDNDPLEGLPDIPAEIGPMNQVYNLLLPVMRVRTVQEDASVLWSNPVTGERVVFGVAGSVTVPPGCRAEPVYGTESALGAGTHAVPESTAFRVFPLADEAEKNP